MTGRSAALLGCCAAPLGWAVYTAGSLHSSVYVLSLAAAASVGYACGDMRRNLWLAAAVLVTMLGWTWTGVNPNVVGCVVALTLAGALSYDIRWYIPIGLVQLVLCGSRGAILAGAVALGAAFRNWYVFIGMALLVLYAATMIHHPGTFAHRLGIWQDTFDILTLWGYGWGTFADVYASLPRRTNALGLMLAPHAYNDYLELLFSLGLFALPLCFAVALVADRLEAPLVVLTFAILALTYFPLHVPVVGHLAMVAFGSTIRNPPCPVGSSSLRTI